MNLKDARDFNGIIAKKVSERNRRLALVFAAHYISVVLQIETITDEEGSNNTLCTEMLSSRFARHDLSQMNIKTCFDRLQLPPSKILMNAYNARPFPTTGQYQACNVLTLDRENWDGSLHRFLG